MPFLFHCNVEKNEKLLDAAEVVLHIHNQGEVSPDDFLKEDFISSPKYKEDPQLYRSLNQVRFDDKSESVPVRRTYVGSKKDYDAYQAVLNKENDRLKKELSRRLKFRAKRASKVVELNKRKKSESKVSSFGYAERESTNVKFAGSPASPTPNKDSRLDSQGSHKWM